MPRRADVIRIATSACSGEVDTGSPTRTCARQRIESTFRNRMCLRVGAGVLLAAMLAGCSDLYYDRRETVSFGAKDAMASALAAQIIDPWPPASADRNIARNGVVVQSAIERYRTCQVIQPRIASSSGIYGNATAQQGAQPGCTPQPAAAATATVPTQGVSK